MTDSIESRLANPTDEQLLQFVAVGLRHAEYSNLKLSDLRPAFAMLVHALAAKGAE